MGRGLAGAGAAALGASGAASPRAMEMAERCTAAPHRRPAHSRTPANPAPETFDAGAACEAGRFGRDDNHLHHGGANDEDEDEARVLVPPAGAGGSNRRGRGAGGGRATRVTCHPLALASLGSACALLGCLAGWMLAGAGIDCAGAACGTGAAAAAAAAAAASSACVAPSAAYARGEQPAWSQRCGGERRAGLPFATRSAVLGTAGAATSSHPLVTAAALEALRAGGSAVDAAVAANAMQALVEPESNGLGGDLMALVWDPAADGGRGALQAYNGAGRSPGALDREQLLRVLDEQHNGTRAIPEKGALAVSVPGAPAGWCDMHARYGRLPLARLLAPAADAAARGFAVTQVIASQWREACALARADADVRREATAGGRYPHALAGMRQLYCSASDPSGPNSGAPAEGDVFANPSLARTLRVLGEEGCGALYNGTLASELLEYLGGVGSALGADDLAAHRGTWEEPVGVTYRDRHRVYELRPDTQGIAALQMLNMMELADVRSLGGHNSADYIHLSVEVKKLAFADRARYYADPAFAAVPVEALTSKAYAKRRFELVDMGRAATEVDAGDPGLQAETPRGADTVYIAVADDSGMMVSWVSCAGVWRRANGRGGVRSLI